jgi:type IX secretion system PorP/SprF family membrane protein
MERRRISCRAFVVITVMVLMSTTVFAQQQIHFTQYMFNGLVINPAYAGADEALSLTFVQRSQWAGVDDAPETQTLSAHTLFGRKHVGIGLNLVNDNVGVHHSLTAVTNYAYHLQVGQHSILSMGLKVGISNQKSDYGSLAVPNVSDPKLMTVSQTFFDFGMGMYFRSPKLHVGFSIPEMLPRTMQINDTASIQGSKSVYMLFVKSIYPVNDFIDIEPGFLLKYINGLPVSFDLNTNMTYRKVLTLGLSYRKKESIDFLFKAQLTPQLQLGYSYDHPIGEISRLANGSHELMVQYVFRYSESKVNSPR